MSHDDGRRAAVLRIGAMAAVAALAAMAQCGHSWLPGQGLPGVNGVVTTMLEWDRDGAGPAPALWIVGGQFTFAGTVPANNVAAFDPATGSWSALGAGVLGVVRELVQMPNGDLMISSNASLGLARWDGVALTQMSVPNLLAIEAMAVLPDGSLVVGGVSSGDAVWRWNGSTWQGLGATGTVYDLVVLPSGELVAGGVGAVFGPAAIRTWNGTAWSPFGTVSGLANARVRSLLLLPNGDLIAGGEFLAVDGVPATRVARRTAVGWQAIGSGVATTVNELAALPNGELWAGGTGVRRWDGVAWSELLAEGGNFVNSMLPIGQEVLVGGTFQQLGGVPVLNLARWSGGAWSALTGGTNGSIESFVRLPNGAVVAMGGFTMIEGVAADRIARRTGATWSPLGSGINGTVVAGTVAPNGDLIAVGAFTQAGGVAANQVARWNGASWSALGAGVNGSLVTVAALANGEVFVGGYLNLVGLPQVARWSGGSWQTVTTPNWGLCMATLPNGDLVVGGFGWVARWTGSGWASLGGGVTGWVTQLVVAGNGDLIAAGGLTSAGGTPVNGVARWNGSAWSPMGAGVSGQLRGTTRLPNGDVLLCGELSGPGLGPVNLARWDGASWARLGPPITAGTAYDAELLPDGALGVATVSAFEAGGSAASYLARLAPNCPAVIAPIGPGCAGSAGPGELLPISLPFVGSTYAAVITGWPVPSLGLSMFSKNTASLPLPQLLPQGVAGCTLWVSPDLLTMLVPTAGQAESTFAIPAVPSLVGLDLHHQVALLEFAAAGDLVAVSVTNAVTLTLGAF
jgi:hypothetical protein